MPQTFQVTVKWDGKTNQMYGHAKKVSQLEELDGVESITADVKPYQPGDEEDATLTVIAKKVQANGPFAAIERVSELLGDADIATPNGLDVETTVDG